MENTQGNSHFEEKLPYGTVHVTPEGRYYDSNGALCGYVNYKQPCASAADDELIKLVQTQLRDKYEKFNHKHDIDFIIEGIHREKIITMQTPYGKQTKPVWAWDATAVNEFWNAVSGISDYEKQTQPPKGQGKRREKLVTIKTAYDTQTKPAWLWERELADKQRGEKIVTIQAVYRDAQGRPVWRREEDAKTHFWSDAASIFEAVYRDAQSRPVWLWEEDAKNVFWRAVHGNDSTLSHMAVFSQGFPWQPPASWKIC